MTDKQITIRRVIIFSILAAVIGAIIVIGVNQNRDFAANCTSLGGTVTTITEAEVNGETHKFPKTTACTTASGKVLAIQGEVTTKDNFQCNSGTTYKVNHSRQYGRYRHHNVDYLCVTDGQITNYKG